MKSDFLKTLNYLKKNGPVKTFWAVKERLEDRKKPPYVYVPIGHEERLDQVASLNNSILFSILVPAFETGPDYMRELINSVRNQTYNKWELVIADASKTDIVKDVVSCYADERIKYVRLENNLGISGNSNAGLEYCRGDYTALLDHDDLLTQEALFENAEAIVESEKKNIKLQVLFSDEDKTNGDNSMYFEPNVKPGFNLDLLLSNNYICHLLVIKTELIKKLGFRSEFDGAQDHDLILRAVSELIHAEGENDSRRIPISFEKYIHHIPRVLYHWRCHEASTAQNPRSKIYAYESGRRAVQDFLNREGIGAEVLNLPHMGFFKTEYKDGILNARPDIGAVGFRITDSKNRIVGGTFDSDMNVMFEGLNVHYSGGSLHRAACQQDVYAVDVRSMIPSDRGIEVLSELMKKYSRKEAPDTRQLSREFCDIMRGEGYRFLYSPEIVVKEKKLNG